MRQAKSMAELEKLIMDDMEKAMNIVFEKSKKTAKDEVQAFYSKGSPTIYKRTGKLGKSSRSYGVNRYGNSVDFYVWLDRTYDYTVPNPAFTDRGFASYFSTPMVFDAAEAGVANIKGRSGFWERTEQQIESDLDSTFARFFN